MLQSGVVDIGCHTHTHADFRGRPAAFRVDLQRSVEVVREQFDRKVVTFAYPFGSPRLGFAGDDLVAAAKQTDAACALTTDSQLVDTRTDPFSWGRFNAFSWDTGSTLAAKLGGWYGWVAEAYRSCAALSRLGQCPAGRRPARGDRQIMKIVLAHCHYQHAGGEDSVFADEAALLAERGHEVVRYTLHNDQINQLGHLAAARRTVWNREVHGELAALLVREQPALLHCTNTFPLMSPAVYYAAATAGVPVVQSLHNYRLLCPNALFLRDGRICEDCLGKRLAWPAIQHACYRDSRAASAVVAGMVATHRALGTWTRRVDRFIVLTEFARRKFIAGGLPAQRLAVKPNFVAPDTGPGNGRGGYALYVGRLAAEKGIEPLLAAWVDRQLDIPLKIVGDGPLAERVRAAAAANPAIQWLGQRKQVEVQAILGAAACLVLPSICYEGLPKTLVEAYCQGTPVVAAGNGALRRTDRTGPHRPLVRPGDAAALAQSIAEFWSHGERWPAMRSTAREVFVARYTAEANYRRLMTIYAALLAERGHRAAAEECAGASEAAAPICPAPTDEASDLSCTVAR